MTRLEALQELMVKGERLERLADTVGRITRRADARGLRKRAEIHKGEK